MSSLSSFFSQALCGHFDQNWHDNFSMSRFDLHPRENVVSSTVSLLIVLTNTQKVSTDTLFVTCMHSTDVSSAELPYTYSSPSLYTVLAELFGSHHVS